MDQMIIQSSVTLFEILCVIVVFASLFIRSRFFNEVFEHHPTWTIQIVIIVFFGIMSIFGTLSGLSVHGAVINVRDLGPMAAGLLCGPYVGIGSGIIGGLFRFLQGGPYMWTGLSAPILSGFLGGVLYLANQRRFVPTWIAVLYIGLSETLISCYTLVLVTPPSEFLSVLTNVALPMIIYTSIGMFIFAVIVNRDLEDRGNQKKVQALELELASRRNLSTIINTIAYPVYVLDREHRFTMVNDSMSRFIGRPQNVILEKTPGNFFGSDDARFLEEMIEDVFRRQATREDERTITRPDGQESTIINTSAVYTDISGQVFMVGVIQDVTGRKKMEVALARSETWYRILFEHTGAATHILNEDGTIDQANSEFMRLIGYSREEVEGKMHMVQFVHPDDIGMVQKYHNERRIDPSSVPADYTVRFVTRSGVTKILHVIVAMIPGTRKSIASFVDISEQKRSEEALTLANRKLNLLSSITRHDIINQLLVLKGFLALLKSKMNQPELVDYFQRVTRAAENIEHQIEFTRDYQDMGVKAPSWSSIRKAIIGAKGALAVGDVTVDVDLPDLELFADPLFDKVFYNLIDNSLRYGGEKVRTIRISSQETDQNLIVTCQDDGVGITDADRAHLFERGFGKHTGLGLFLSREILSITGITIRETGSHGVGARFEILVPKGVWRIAGTGR